MYLAAGCQNLKEGSCSNLYLYSAANLFLATTWQFIYDGRLIEVVMQSDDAIFTDQSCNSRNMTTDVTKLFLDEWKPKRSWFFFICMAQDFFNIL